MKRLYVMGVVFLVVAAYLVLGASLGEEEGPFVKFFNKVLGLFNKNTKEDLSWRIDGMGGWEEDKKYDSKFLEKEWRDLVKEEGLLKQMRLYLSAITNQKMDLVRFAEQRFTKDGEEVIIHYVEAAEMVVIWRDASMQRLDIGDGGFVVIDSDVLIVFRSGKVIVGIKAPDYETGIYFAGKIIKIKKSRIKKEGLCESYETTCPTKKGVENSDVSYCDEESFLLDKEKCIRKVAQSLGDVSLCDMLTIEKGICVKNIKKI